MRRWGTGVFDEPDRLEGLGQMTVPYGKTCLANPQLVGFLDISIWTGMILTPTLNSSEVRLVRGVNGRSRLQQELIEQSNVWKRVVVGDAEARERTLNQPL